MTVSALKPRSKEYRAELRKGETDVSVYIAWITAGRTPVVRVFSG